ncbi:MAG: hypothetical protein ACFFA2_11655 [Promethearchaeota archaeon]
MSPEKTQIFLISKVTIKINMDWEKVIRHGNREDMYIYKVLTPHDKIEPSDKNILKNILLEEVAKEEQD